MRNRYYSLGLVFALVPMTGVLAQTPQSEAIAEALFRSGQTLMKEGKVLEACEKFAASYQMDPALGTLLNLAVCHEKAGRTASAWSEFSDVVAKGARAGQADRVAFAQARLRALEPKLVRVVVTVLAPGPGLEVRIDGNPLPRAAWGVPIPMDPGSHVVEATQPKKVRWVSTLTLGPERTQAPRSLEVPPLDALAAAPSPGAPRAATPVEPPLAPRLEARPEPSSVPPAAVAATAPIAPTVGPKDTTTATATTAPPGVALSNRAAPSSPGGWIACGTAVLALGGGAVTAFEGLAAKARYDEAAAMLVASPVQTDTGIAAYNQLVAEGNTANQAAWIAGGGTAAAVVVTGVLAYLSYRQTGAVGPFRF